MSEPRKTILASFPDKGAKVKLVQSYSADGETCNFSSFFRFFFFFQFFTANIAFIEPTVERATDSCRYFAARSSLVSVLLLAIGGHSSRLVCN